MGVLLFQHIPLKLEIQKYLKDAMDVLEAAAEIALVTVNEDALENADKLAVAAVTTHADNMDVHIRVVNPAKMDVIRHVKEHVAVIVQGGAQIHALDFAIGYAATVVLTNALSLVRMDVSRHAPKNAGIFVKILVELLVEELANTHVQVVVEIIAGIYVEILVVILVKTFAKGTLLIGINKLKYVAERISEEYYIYSYKRLSTSMQILLSCR